MAAGLAVAVVMSFGGFAAFGGALTAPASASTTPASGGVSTPAACTINSVAGKTCNVTITSFKDVHGVVYAIGTVTAHGTALSFATPVRHADPAACSILHRTLGPLHLNLLGLVVNLNRVHLTIRRCRDRATCSATSCAT
jgi:hypothetical protein